MSLLYTEEEILGSVGRLSRRQLTVWVDADLVRPTVSEQGPRFSQMDCARLELICDLCEAFDMDEEALAMVLSLIDQLHAVRAELRSLAKVIDDAPDDVRGRIASALIGKD